jgi:hypothetical protein
VRFFEPVALGGELAAPSIIKRMAVILKPWDFANHDIKALISRLGFLEGMKEAIQN